MESVCRARPGWAWLLAGVAIVGMQMPARAQPPKKIDFIHDIVPIIKSRCAECHTNGKYKGSLSLDTRESVLKKKVIVPGKSGESKLFRKVSSKDAEERMPPKGEPLTARQLELIRTWIDEGMTWEPGFSFKVSDYIAPLRPRRPAIP